MNDIISNAPIDWSTDSFRNSYAPRLDSNAYVSVRYQLLYNDAISVLVAQTQTVNFIPIYSNMLTYWGGVRYVRYTKVAPSSVRVLQIRLTHKISR